MRWMALASFVAPRTFARELGPHPSSPSRRSSARHSGDPTGSLSGAPPSSIQESPTAATGASAVAPLKPSSSSFKDAVQGRSSGFSHVVREAPDPVIPVP